ncbi:MAG: peptide-methionine (S)-S-oxide reductase [Rhodospirillales bacterium]|jgi:peptide-methionine (S)-S-oxide reductase|nr:peptide-methionine (S)-S-oxide reductase [Rhodospirillales bacterium]
MSKKCECAVFGANCYWGAEAAFGKVTGVVDTAVGFMGDSLCDCSVPTSDQHAKDMTQVEVVKVDFDPAVISYVDLIDVFLECHNASHNVYRPEDGKPSLERSVIFVGNEEQRKAAQNALAQLTAIVTTSIEASHHFHRADEEEQRYLERNEGAVCAMKDAAAE